MRSWSIVCGALGSIAAAGGAHAATLSDADYKAQVQHLLAGDAPVDYPALHAAAPGKAGAGYASFDPKDADKAWADGHPEKALDLAEAYLKTDPLDTNAHLIAAAAAKKIGNDAAYRRHHAAFRGLMDAILATGDGLSAETAYQVVGVDEEYMVLRFRDLKPGQQSLTQRNGKSFDVLAAVDEKTGKETDLWFDVSSFYGSLFH